MNAEIESKLNSAHWYHQYEVLPGIISPGKVPFDAAQRFEMLGAPKDMTGLKALDVGTWDGPLAFEMEARGAEVCAVDVQDPDCTAFNTARSLRNSRVRYEQASVYDVNQLFTHKFDIVTYWGVYYHLKHPILGFEALADVLADGGRLYFEGEVLLTYSENHRGEPSNLDNQRLAESDVPLTLCYSGKYKGSSNWFVPNLACLRGWLETAGLELLNFGVVSDVKQKPFPCQRIYGTAVKSKVLEMMDEIGIFEKNLHLPENLHRKTELLEGYRRSHRPLRLADAFQQRFHFQEERRAHTPGGSNFALATARQWARSFRNLLKGLGGQAKRQANVANQK